MKSRSKEPHVSGAVIAHLLPVSSFKVWNTSTITLADRSKS
mgnify:CR=1 FL=1